MTFSVYTLSDPRTGYVRYVGFTSVSLALRLRRHLDDGNPSHRRNWIKSLRAAGVRPRIKLLEEYDDSESAFDAEREWISMARHLGCDLVNMTDGGEGTLGVSVETRAKMRAAKLGKKLSAEHKAKIGAASRAAGCRPPVRYGPVSEATREKMRAAARSPNHKIPKGWNKGMQLPPQSEETKAKRAASLRGLKRTAEQRERMSDAKRAWWAARKAS